MRALPLVLCITALAACASPVRHGKPTAAVTVALADRDLGGGDHELTLTATPTRDVRDLELALDGRRILVGAAPAGQGRTLTARVHVAPGAGRDIVGAAWVGGRNEAAVVHVGAAHAVTARPTRIVTMPDGTVVEEVRP